MFLGFLPKSYSRRRELIKDYGFHDASLVIYESPKKVRDLLGELKDVLGNREASIVKDVTKKFESVATDNIEKLINSEIKEKGEYVVIVAKEGYKLHE